MSCEPGGSFFVGERGLEGFGVIREPDVAVDGRRHFLHQTLEERRSAGELVGEVLQDAVWHVVAGDFSGGKAAVYFGSKCVREALQCFRLGAVQKTQLNQAVAVEGGKVNAELGGDGGFLFRGHGVSL